jgi:hypothetical protein
MPKKMAAAPIGYGHGRHFVLVEVLSEAKGWAMIRRKGAMPTVVRSRELLPETEAVDIMPKKTAPLMP